MNASKEKIIELDNVSVTYKERKTLFKSDYYKVLKNLSFDVYKGETLGIIGRNGAGKSTLLRVLAGIIEPDSGRITHHTKSVSLMSLAAGFDPNLSGLSNVIISGLLFGYSRKYITSKLDEIKLFSELQDFFEKPVKTYSSGMLARLAFSIAIYISPDVLLIDEVLGVGDVSFRKKAEQAIADKIASDITVIIVTHSEAQISGLASRIIWIDGGRVRKSGLPQEIFPEYNININFSTYGVKVVNYELNENYVARFEVQEKIDDKIKFNVLVLNKNDEKINQIICNDGESEYLLDGPSETPGFSQQFVDLKTAKKSRYKNGCSILEKDLKLISIVNNKKELVLKMKLDVI